MKFYNFNPPKFILWLGILLAAGCSPGVMSSPNFNSTLLKTPTNSPSVTYTLRKMPTSQAVATPSLSLLPGKIAFINSNGAGYYYRLYVMKADGSGIKDITPSLPEIMDPRWSTDGEYIAFDAVTDGKSQIFTIKANGSDLKQLTFGEEDSNRPSWSPDGKNIIFVSSQKDILDYRGDIAQQGYIMKSDGTGIRRLNAGNEFVEGLSYRTDNFISVSVPASPDTIRTYIINSEGVIQKQFPEFTIDGIPVWSPDNKLVVYNTIRADCSGIVVMKPDGSDQVCLVLDKIISPPTYVGKASWSPDSKYIIFSSNLSGDWNIYVIKPDGSDLTRLTNLPGDESWPVWTDG
jgi:Tol biopolymer transport system component